MTENEAINRLKKRPYEAWKHGMADLGFDNATEIAISALEEIQQYRSIGTVSECRESMEKQRAKKTHRKYMVGSVTIGYCPSCNMPATRQDCYCNSCGQKLDWGDSDE